MNYTHTIVFKTGHEESVVQHIADDLKARLIAKEFSFTGYTEARTKKDILFLDPSSIAFIKPIEKKEPFYLSKKELNGYVKCTDCGKSKLKGILCKDSEGNCII